MSLPQESFKTFCNRVAEAVVTEDGALATRLLRLTGLMGPEAGAAGASAEDAVDPETSGQVGIWERKEEGGQNYFARRLDMIEDWNYWANLGQIEPKGTKRRVVFIGESVARGYLYDPQFTPAMALGSILDAQMGAGEVEVIDLARTNLGLEVRELALAALQLEPDAVIIFSGNNWGASFPLETEEFALIDTVLREDGVPGLKRYIERQLEGNIRRVVNDVATRYEARSVPLIWIAPEFNLGDWRDPVTNAPHLAKGVNRQWIEAWEEAKSALEEDDLEKATELAQRMVELDGGVSVAGLYILAECCRRQGDQDGVKRYLEVARDAVIWDPSRSTSPRTYAVTRRTLLEAVADTRGHAIDMSEVFAHYLDGAIPDRRMFLDYCHLTTEGIQVTMAAAASRVLGVLEDKDAAWKDLVDSSIAPSPEVEAEAAFLAAVHNAHWWQSFDLVRHFCLRSVEHSPKIAEVMTRFIDIQTRRTPMLMCRAAQEIVELGSPLIQHYLLRYNNQQLDQLLINGVVDALKAVGVDAEAVLAELRREEHSAAAQPANLLDYYYNSAALQPQEVMWVVPRRQGQIRYKENDYYKAYWLESGFTFIGEAGSAVELHLTCRLPEHATADGAVTLVVNGQKQGNVILGREWDSWDVTIAGEVVKDGVNQITLRWPLAELPDERQLGGVIDDLIGGVFPEFFCSFGEIHSFTVTDARSGDSAAA